MPARHAARRERLPSRAAAHARLQRTRTAKRVAAEKVLEDVKGVAAEAAAAAAHALLQRILAVVIVNLALLGVRQHLIRCRNLLELPTQARPRPARVSRAALRSRARRHVLRARAFSGSPPLSGWFLMAAFLYARFSSSGDTLRSTASSS